MTVKFMCLNIMLMEFLGCIDDCTEDGLTLGDLNSKRKRWFWIWYLD